MCANVFLPYDVVRDKKCSINFFSSLYQTSSEQLRTTEKCLQSINCNWMKQKRKIHAREVFPQFLTRLSSTLRSWMRGTEVELKSAEFFTRRRENLLMKGKRIFFIEKKINKGSYTQEPQSFIKSLSSLAFLLSLH